MDNVKIFENPDFGTVRALILNNSLWFVARDIALACGYTKKQLRHLGVLMAKVPANFMSVFNVAQTTRKGVESVFPLSIISLDGVEFFINSKHFPIGMKLFSWLTNHVVPEMEKNTPDNKFIHHNIDGKLCLNKDTYDFLANLYANLGLSPQQTACAIDRIWKQEFGYSAIEQAGIKLEK